MANSFLIEIGMNDALQDVIRKCNANFRHVAYTQVTQTRSEIKRETSGGISGDVDVDAAIARIKVAQNNAITQIGIVLEEALADMKKQETEIKTDLDDYSEVLESNIKKNIDSYVSDLLDQIKIEIAPAVGTYILCDYDPNEQWPGTSWTQIYEFTLTIKSDDNEDEEEIVEDDIVLPLWYRQS